MSEVSLLTPQEGGIFGAGVGSKDIEADRPPRVRS